MLTKEKTSETLFSVIKLSRKEAEYLETKVKYVEIRDNTLRFVHRRAKDVDKTIEEGIKQKVRKGIKERVIEFFSTDEDSDFLVNNLVTRVNVVTTSDNEIILPFTMHYNKYSTNYVTSKYYQKTTNVKSITDKNITDNSIPY